ncbi:hypothetical protein ACQJBY_020154 [Aegilops geniculata]
MADAALAAAQWVVGKALAPVADGVLEAWAASRNFGLNIEALGAELLKVQAMLERAATKELVGPATEKLLQNLQDSAHNAEDLLDELDYFRIHDKLHKTYEAADEHGKGCVCDLALNVRHTTKALGKQVASLCAYCFGANAGHPRQEDARHNVSCCAWQRGRQRSKMSAGHSSSVPKANQIDQEVSGCMPKLGKLFKGSSSPHPHVSGDEDRGNVQEIPIPEFNRVEFSQKIKDTLEQLKRMSEDVDKILKHCGPRTVLDVAQHRPITTPQSAEPKLYGRDLVMNSIIHDITKGQYCDKGLTMLPVIGPGGMGKTTMIQHIYNNEQVQNHFPVRIWICVSFNLNLGKVLEEIKRYTPSVEGENECVRPEELIEQRLKYKRFLLVLDDIWQFTDVDDWKKLLLILGKSQEKGSIILVTTRQKEIADQVNETEEPKELGGLEPGEFRKLFLVYVFDAEQYPRDKLHLLDTGDEIMGKLKGSPLAAKTVGRLLRTDPSLAHWRRVLNSKQWAEQTNGIMAALKLSYDFLPFHLQRCFSYSALFPEDYRFRSRELISLWIGLDILTPCGQNPTFEGIGLSILNDLVIHGFFREEDTNGNLGYVMHDLLHELALKVSSHDCLHFRLSDVGSVEIKTSTRHLSISIDNLGSYNAVSGQKLMRELEKVKTRLKVEQLQTLMLFGAMDEGFAKIFGDSLGEANALRVLYLPDMNYPLESMLHNFSGLVHLRFLHLGYWNKSELQLPLSISKFYHLRVLDLESWHGSGGFPEDISNLAKLCHYHTPRADELHSDICNVEKLKLLEKLKVFRVNKKSEGFEPKQLEHLTKLRELGIYNLEKIQTEDEAAQVKLIEKKCLRRLALYWDSEQFSVEPCMEGVVLQSLQPHEDLQVLCIRGYGGPSCPTWLHDDLDLRELRLKDMARLKEFIIGKSFCMLIKLELIGLTSLEKWVYPAELEASLDGEQLPTDAHMFPLLQVLVIRKCPKFLEFPVPNHMLYPDWFPKLQELEIQDCPEFLSPLSWTENLCCVKMESVKLLKSFKYSRSSNGEKLEIVGEGDLHSLDQVLIFSKETGLEELRMERCPPLELKHLLMLTSLKTLIVINSVSLAGPLGGQGDVEWQLPVETLEINNLNGDSGMELTELLPHLPKLSKLITSECKNIKKLVVGVDVQQTTSEASEMGEGEITAVEEEEEEEVLLFPEHLCDSLQELELIFCPKLVLADPPTLVPGGGGLQALRSLQRLTMLWSPKFLSVFSFSCQIFPSSMQFLYLSYVKGMGTLEPLSNLSSLTTLELRDCGEDLKCHGLQSLLTAGGSSKN